MQPSGQSMDLNAVAVFVKIVEAGSLSAAARLLKMPTTTVSARLAALEQALGVSLILRTTRRLHITEAGRKYFDHCVAAIRQMEQGQAELASTSGHPQGVLRITAPADIAHAILPAVVDAYTAKYPDVSVELLITNRVVDLLEEGVDLAIRAGTLKDSTLIARRFFKLTAHVWATPKFMARQPKPTQPGDLAGLDFTCFADQKALKLVRGGKSVTVNLKGRAKADDFETIKALILQGSSVGWMPDFLAAEAVKKKLLVPVLPEWEVGALGEVYFVYASQKYQPPKVRAFMEVALASGTAGVSPKPAV